MDKIAKHKQIARQLLEEIGSRREISRLTMRNQYFDKFDIVLAYHPEYVREDTGFGVM